MHHYNTSIGYVLFLFVFFSLSTSETVTMSSSAGNFPTISLDSQLTASASFVTTFDPLTTTDSTTTSSMVAPTSFPTHNVPSTAVASSNATSGFQTSTTTLSPYCNADNELRALERFSTDAKVFCPTFLQTPTGTFPNYLQGLSTPNMESACACFLNTTRKLLSDVSGTRAPGS